MSNCLCCGATENVASLGERRLVYCSNNNCTRNVIPDREYDEAFVKAKPFSLLSYDQGLTLWRLAKAMPDGAAMAELGVYKGGSAMIVRQARPETPLYLFDTFTGHPDNDRSHDKPGTHLTGSLGDTSVEQVLSRVKATACPGVFPDAPFASSSEPLGLVHIDVDIYESVLAGLEYLAPRVVSGGSIVLDDWKTEDCPGVVAAFEEWSKGKPGYDALEIPNWPYWEATETERGYQLVLTKH